MSCRKPTAYIERAPRPASGALEIEVLNTQLGLDEALFDADGAAIVIHEGADDYASDPAGAAGPRIACGVIQQ